MSAGFLLSCYQGLLLMFLFKVLMFHVQGEISELILLSCTSLSKQSINLSAGRQEFLCGFKEQFPAVLKVALFVSSSLIST